MAIIFQVIGTLLFVYSLLIALRIILTWFQGPSYGQAWDMLAAVTDPYLRWFRRIRWLRRGMFDFTPLAAVLVLVVLQNIVALLSLYGTLKAGIVLAIIVRALWGSAAWILIFFLVLAAVRLVSLYAARNPVAPIWHTLDLMVQPVAGWVNRLVGGGRLDYAPSLIASVVLLLCVWLAGAAIAGVVSSALARLPF
jgi:YggT family protein